MSSAAVRPHKHQRYSLDNYHSVQAPSLWFQRQQQTNGTGFKFLFYAALTSSGISWWYSCQRTVQLQKLFITLRGFRLRRAAPRRAPPCLDKTDSIPDRRHLHSRGHPDHQPPHDMGETKEHFPELISQILEEAPAARKGLIDTSSNLLGVADYCENKYLQVSQNTEGKQHKGLCHYFFFLIIMK